MNCAVSISTAFALERLLREEGIARAVAAAPPEIREMLAFLRLVGRRDVAAIRGDGKRLLETPIAARDPAFHAHVLVATAIACLVPSVDPACRPVWDALDRVQRRAPVLDLLRAHRAARG